MGSDCCKELANLFLRAGLVILVVSFLAATIMFGEYCTKVTEDYNLELNAILLLSYRIKDPTGWDGEMYDCSVTITICGCIGAAAAIGAIVVSVFMAGNTIILIVVGAVAAVLAIICIITEGVFYSYNKSKNIYTNLKINDYTYVRNSSRAQSYIKEALKDLYERGMDNIKAAYLDNYHDCNEEKSQISKADLDKMKKWNDVEKLFDEQWDYINDYGITVTKVFNYPDIWKTDDLGYKIGDKEIYALSLAPSLLDDGLIYANYNQGLCRVPVASLKFNHSESIKMKRLVCTNNSAQLECDEVEGQSIGFEGVNLGKEPFTLKQNLMRKDKYKNRAEMSSRLHDKGYDYNFLVSDFPIAYHKVDYSEVKNQEKKTEDEPKYFYEKDDKHFKFSAESYTKSYYRAMKKKATRVDKQSYFWMCSSKPSSWEEAFEGTEPKCPDKFRPGQYSSEIENPINVEVVAEELSRDSDDEYAGAFFDSFTMTNIGKYPSFYMSYKERQNREQVFTYAGIGFDREALYINSNKLAQFAIASLIIQIFGVIFWACGKFLELFSGQNSD